MLSSTKRKEIVFSYKLKVCLFYMLFQKNHIFLDNRIHSKIKEEVCFIFFLWLHFPMVKKKEGSQTRNLYESYIILATIHFYTSHERRGGEWIQSIWISPHPCQCTAAQSKNGMYLQTVFQNRMVFFSSFSASVLFQKAAN